MSAHDRVDWSPANPDAGAWARLCLSVRFPVTICALFFGDHFTLAERLLSHLFRLTPTKLFNLRAGLNQVCAETERLVEGLASTFPNVSVYREPANIYKAPFMRRLFHEPAVPTRWTIWFDDDSYPTRPDWLLSLGLAIESNPGASCLGKCYLVRPDEPVLQLIRTARWFRGRPFRESKKSTRTAASGSTFQPAGSGPFDQTSSARSTGRIPG